MDINFSGGTLAQHLSESAFLELTEITGGLHIENVAGLKSVGELFPNLVRISGNETIIRTSFSLALNPDLENIGLTKLKSIARGSLLIYANRDLCYVNTVNWSKIVRYDFLEIAEVEVLNSPSKVSMFNQNLLLGEQKLRALPEM